MSHKASTYQSSNRSIKDQNSLGELMRAYGERYIKAYAPYRERISLIRAMRICKSPALGGKVIICKQCNEKHFVYFSCGHSHCPICQSIKREQWVDKLRAELYKVLYVHTTFTLPHDLNGLARMNQSKIYGLLMRSAWKTIKQVTKDHTNIGALPGMISVLHTRSTALRTGLRVRHEISRSCSLSHNFWWAHRSRRMEVSKA